jgi:hypothetical protein
MDDLQIYQVLLTVICVALGGLQTCQIRPLAPHVLLVRSQTPLETRTVHCVPLGCTLHTLDHHIAQCVQSGEPPRLAAQHALIAQLVIME